MGTRGLDELLWDVGKGLLLTKNLLFCFSYLFLTLFYPPFCFLFIWISLTICYQGMLSFRFSLRRPRTVNESYMHLITGLVLHEAERGGVAFPGHIPHPFKPIF